MDEYSKKLLEKNLELTEEIHKMTKKINRFVIWSQVLSFLKLLIIVVPIVLGIIYLPPLLKDIFSQYQNLLGGMGDINNSGDLLKGLLPEGEAIDSGGIDLNQLPSKLQEMLK